MFLLVLAYEVTRQLQEMGDTVDTIVMLDSLFTSEFKEMELSTNNKQAMLGAANNALQAWIQGSPEKFHQTFIHRDEVDKNLDDESFLDQLVNLAKQRGLTVDAKQLRHLILKDAEAQQAYGVNRFSVLPLADPDGVVCYYFRNKNGSFLGELEPYFQLDANLSFDRRPG